MAAASDMLKRLQQTISQVYSRLSLTKPTQRLSLPSKMSNPSAAESSSTSSKRSGSPSLLSTLPAKRPAPAPELEISEEDALNVISASRPQGAQQSPGGGGKQKSRKERRKERMITDRRDLKPWKGATEEDAVNGEVGVGKGKERAAESEEEGEEGEGKTKLPKRKVALFIG